MIFVQEILVNLRLFFAWNDMKFHWNHVVSCGFSDLGDASKTQTSKIWGPIPLIATASF